MVREEIVTVTIALLMIGYLMAGAVTAIGLHKSGLTEDRTESLRAGLLWPLWSVILAVTAVTASAGTALALIRAAGTERN